MLEMLPTVMVGSSRLVERDILETFVGRVDAAEDARGIFARMREEKQVAPRKAIRSLVQRDESEVSLDGRPEAVRLSRGRLEVYFDTVADLAQAMYWIARVLSDDGDRFAAEYEKEIPAVDAGIEEVRAMFDDLDRLE